MLGMSNAQTFPIFDKLGGQQEAFDAIERRTGWRPNRPALNKWFHEGRLSHRVGLVLAIECSEKSIAVEDDDFKVARSAVAA